jgi:hypothetical protein
VIRRINLGRDKVKVEKLRVLVKSNGLAESLGYETRCAGGVPACSRLTWGQQISTVQEFFSRMFLAQDKGLSESLFATRSRDSRGDEDKWR